MTFFDIFFYNGEQLVENSFAMLNAILLLFLEMLN